MEKREPGASAASETTPPANASGSPEAVGSRIGPYRLLQNLGEGGMGAVWVAEQQEPVKRRVALKVIKPGLDSAQVLRRFEAERQALALMDHPNIAKVLDAGTTPEGRPYFAMELVQGVPIIRYCDELHLPIKERLELFIPVCQSIQHAHQKGIIHRDIKPSNVLVCIQGGRPVPKVIDFGVAKALHQRLTEETIYTEIGAVIGTLEYMSPEQAEMSALGVDTRADVYALGVLLYELLTGTTPLDKKRLRRAAYTEMVRMIKEEEPPKPSTRLTESKESLASVAALRRTEPARLTKEVRGDLDWIVMKALEKDRTRRYEAASGLARDIERHLHDEPVEACPPSARYRLKKFARRNKVPVLAATSLLLLLLAGIVGTSWGLVRAERARLAEAEQRQLAQVSEQKALAAADAERQAKETAQAREEETRAVLDFVENKVFAAARPEGQEGGLGRNVMLRRAVEAALPFVDKSFTNQPLIEARLRMTLGNSFRCLGEAKIAADQFQAARAILTKHGGPEHPDTLKSMNNLANSYEALGRHADALKLREETLALQKAKLGPDDPNTLASMNNLALSYKALGRHADALKLHQETLALQKAKLGPDHPGTLNSMNNLALSYAALGRYGDALKLNEETLALRKAKLGPEHPDTLYSMNNLAITYRDLGRYGDALKLNEETLALMKAKLGPDHPDTLVSMDNLALSYAALGRYADALKLREETLALKKAKLGPDHPDTLVTMFGVAGSLSKLDRCAEALPICRATAEKWEKRNHTDPESLYNAACFRAVTAAVIHGADKSAGAAKEAAAEADRAMAWLKQAVAAGFNDAAQMKKDSDLDALRDREDFKKLLAALEASKEKEKK
jgi:eukaryotic-like serine/threonine-protein kinase